jgi:glycerol-3-phosphate acyltransferase PlsY
MDVLIILFAYLLGTVPTGRMVAKARGIEITRAGSGNVGATNVARTAGRGAGIITLAGDIAKGIIGALIGRWYFDSPSGAAIAGLATVSGHCFSIPGILTGGKGVATSIGVIAVVSPLLSATAIAIFSATFKISRTVSIASIAAAVGVPLVGAVLGIPFELWWPLATIGALVLWRHRPNIDRILKGKEPTFSLGGAPEPPVETPR